MKTVDKQETEKGNAGKKKRGEKFCYRKYSHFFAKALKPDNIDEILKKTQAFIKNEKVILITSGGTKVPIEKANVRNIQNFSTGKRGALLCEYFLKINKKVIFLYCKDSAVPYEHNLHCMLKLENVDLQGNQFLLNVNKEQHKSLFESFINYKKYSKNLLLLPYETVYEYGFYLLELCALLNQKTETHNKEQRNVEIITTNSNKFSQYISSLKNKINDILLFFTRCDAFRDTVSLKSESEKLLQQLIYFQKKYVQCFSKESTRILTFFNTVQRLLKRSTIDGPEVIKQHRKQVISEIVALVYEVEKNEKESNTEKETCVSMENDKLKTKEVQIECVFPSHLVILCAAASDFYIPFSKMHDQKIQSDNELHLHLSIVPKFYKIINKYFSLLKLCIFKLECDQEELIEKSRKRLKYADLLISNILEHRYHYVIIFKRGMTKQLSILTKPEIEPIENRIAEYICKYFQSNST